MASCTLRISDRLVDGCLAGHPEEVPDEARAADELDGRVTREGRHRSWRQLAGQVDVTTLERGDLGLGTLDVRMRICSNCTARALDLGFCAEHDLLADWTYSWDIWNGPEPGCGS